MESLQELPDSILTLVLSDFRVGRFWHGAVRLREAMAGGEAETPEGRLLLARGDAGWGNWPPVLVLLKDPLTEGGLSGSLPWYLLGRAQAESGDFAAAQISFTAAMAGSGRGGNRAEAPDEAEVLLHRARARLVLGDVPGALADLRGVQDRNPWGGRWLALDLARSAAEAGIADGTMAFLSEVSHEDVRHIGWDLPARALLVSGDSAGAEAAYWGAIPSLRSPSERALAWERVGALRMARADSVGARAAFHRVLGEDPRGGSAMGAAFALLTLGFDSASVARVGAEALTRGGHEREALEAYHAFRALHGEPPPSDVTLALARLHRSLQAPRQALALLDSLEADGASPPSPSILVERIRGLSGSGRASDARAMQDSLIASFPDRPESVEILFLRADALHDRGDLRGAIRGFEAAAALSPSQNLAGQARMRLGQIHLSGNRGEEAARVFQGYMEAFPEGRRWDEAAFWAGRTLIEGGQEDAGASILEDLRRRFALSYYSVQSGVLLGVPYDPPIPAASATPPLTQGLSSALDRIDRLRAMGLVEGADWEFRILADSIRAIEDESTRRGLLLRLALEVNEQGLTREGINLGWEVRRLGADWDRDLLSAIYPFPYREMVLEEAKERGVDPFLMAGLMRQESAFWHEAKSTADARGLMQVLPATGRELARARGPRGFDADEHLYRPEINLHLGMSFFSDLRRRFGEDLSIILSAYNAGPSRALRWRNYPETGDIPRFVERIPFTETRGYVKNVLLNREIYTWLYGGRDEGG